ncbi:MAG: class I SAM-dependent methyltransferase [Pseudomonadota bacterium]
MDTAEFDKFADEYVDQHANNIAASGDDPEYFARYKITDLAADVAARGGDLDAELSIVDFGSGIGASVPHLASYFPNAKITAADVSSKSLAINKERHGDKATHELYDGKRLPLDNASVDIAFAACVFHHIDPKEHDLQLRGLRRVLKPGGALYVFEHNPWNPVTRRAVNTCPFDENAFLITGPRMRKSLALAGFDTADPVYRYFFPSPLKLFRPMEKLMKSVPIGAQYFVRGIKRA